MCKANPLAFLQPPKASCLRESHSYARNRWLYAPGVKPTIRKNPQSLCLSLPA